MKRYIQFFEGFKVDNKTNKIAAPAPLFYHGNSLFKFVGRDDLVPFETLNNYANTMLPIAYDDFIGTARKALTPELHEGLRRLTTFKFKKNPRYNWDNHRLKITEKVINERARKILKK